MAKTETAAVGYWALFFFSMMWIGFQVQIAQYPPGDRSIASSIATETENVVLPFQTEAHIGFE